MAQTTERTIPKEGDNYPGFCCQGWDYLICLIFPDDNIGRTEIYGVCQNPDCPNFTEGYPLDPWRGVDNCDLDDFEERLREASANTFNWHCSAGHNADFEVCGNETCKRVREIEIAFNLVAV